MQALIDEIGSKWMRVSSNIANGDISVYREKLADILKCLDTIDQSLLQDLSDNQQESIPQLDDFFNLLEYSNSGDELEDIHYDRALDLYPIPTSLRANLKQFLKDYFKEKYASDCLDFERVDYILYNDSRPEDVTSLGESFLKSFSSQEASLLKLENFEQDFLSTIKRWLITERTAGMDFVDYLSIKLGFINPDGELDVSCADYSFYALLKKIVLNRPFKLNKEEHTHKRLTHFVCDLMVIALFNEILKTRDNFLLEKYCPKILALSKTTIFSKNLCLQAFERDEDEDEDVQIIDYVEEKGSETLKRKNLEHEVSSKKQKLSREEKIELLNKRFYE